jgi:hypothetical protein
MSLKWSFKINADKFTSEDLLSYQECLQEIKTIYDDKIQKEYNNTDVTITFYDGELPPPNNIFASFQYDCIKHVTETENNNWVLVWDPLNEQDKNKLFASFNIDCAPLFFIKTSDEILTILQIRLPNCIEYNYGKSNNNNDDNDNEEQLRFEFIDNDEDDDDDYIVNRLHFDSHDSDYYIDTLMGSKKFDTEYCDIDCGYCGKCVYETEIPDYDYY